LREPELPPPAAQSLPLLPLPLRREAAQNLGLMVAEELDPLKENLSAVLDPGRGATSVATAVADGESFPLRHRRWQRGTQAAALFVFGLLATFVLTFKLAAPRPSGLRTSLQGGSKAVELVDSSDGVVPVDGAIADARQCHTATYGEKCHTSVVWAMTTGIARHPDWFPGLSQASTFEDFQGNVHRYNASRCPRPCAPQSGLNNLPSLFCFAVARMDGPEENLLKAQLNMGAGIFGCEEHAVLSDVVKELGSGPKGRVTTVHIPSTQVSGYSKDGTAPNELIFMEAWEAIHRDGRFAQKDWTVKVDPDTVFVSMRLRKHLVEAQQAANPYPVPYTTPASAGVFVPNCDKMASWGKGWGDGWPMMYGSIEILSRQAVQTYFAQVSRCKNEIAWQNLGEDAFLGVCLRKLKVGEVFMKTGDALCGGATCSDHRMSSYHPFKTVDAWLQCWSEAI